VLSLELFRFAFDALGSLRDHGLAGKSHGKAFAIGTAGD
jgi:hypothetical protein